MSKTLRIVYRKPGNTQVKEATHVKPFTNPVEAEDELARLIVKHPQWDFWLQVGD